MNYNFKQYQGKQVDIVELIETVDNRDAFSDLIDESYWASDCFSIKALKSLEREAKNNNFTLVGDFTRADRVLANIYDSTEKGLS
jgi:hypothetical protein